MREGMLTCIYVVSSWGVGSFQSQRLQTPAISLRHVHIVALACSAQTFHVRENIAYSKHKNESQRWYVQLHILLLCFPSLFVCVWLNLKLLMPSVLAPLLLTGLCLAQNGAHSNLIAWTPFKPEYMNVSAFLVQLLLFHVCSVSGCFSPQLICNS